MTPTTPAVSRADLPANRPSLAQRPTRRGPFVRWPRTADALLAVVVFVVTTVLVDTQSDTVRFRSPAEVPALYLVTFAVAAIALYWRRSRPLVVLAVALGCWATQIGSEFANGGSMAIVALYSTGRWATDVRKSIWGVGAAMLVLVVDGVLAATPWGEVVFGVVAMEFAWYLGRRFRLAKEAEARLQREQQTEIGRIKAEERTRIARELHDVVAHRVSSMTVQAGAARAVAEKDPDAALRAMAAVEEAGRQALDELRHLLGVLRLGSEVDGPGPQPGVADLERLAAETRQLGLAVSLDLDGVGDNDLPARVELSAYRIVQESLTNVIKHAGLGTAVAVRLAVDDEQLEVEVTDDGRGSGGLPGTGHGIVGMRERATLLGGTLSATPRPGGGFAVVAHLPLHGPSA